MISIQNLDPVTGKTEEKTILALLCKKPRRHLIFYIGITQNNGVKIQNGKL